MKTSVLCRLAALLLLTSGHPDSPGSTSHVPETGQREGQRDGKRPSKTRWWCWISVYGITITGSGVSSSRGQSDGGYLVITSRWTFHPGAAQAAAAGTPYQQAVLTGRLATMGDERRFTPSRCGRARGRRGANGLYHWGPANPLTEKVSLQYGSIQWAYGSTKAGYNFANNQKAIVLDDPDTQNGGAVEVPKARRQLQLSPLK